MLLFTPAGLIFTTGVHAQVPVDQQPLTVSNNVPGNVVLTPSVEWPTVLSMSNLGGFNPSKLYGGYFDPNKCYTYNPEGAIPTDTPAPQEADPKGRLGYFEPSSVSLHSPLICSGEWSGNYLNWAATQTIDTFRSVMTGGYRVVDEPKLTVLEKARHTGQETTGITGNRTISGAAVTSQTPAQFSYLETRITGLGNKLYFITANSKDGVRICKIGETEPCSGKNLRDVLNDPEKYGVTPYDGDSIDAGVVYSVNVDVRVCAPDLLETNCVRYPSGDYKPEGMIQKYSKTLKYSVFGYLNITAEKQDGAALRAEQKFVGPKTYSPVDGAADNPAKEWYPDTGVLVANPDPEAATSTSSDLGVTIGNSGVINYLNKFGEMYAGNDKGQDPVSEMYYAAIRYLKGQTEVSSYSQYLGTDNVTAKMADGFPVIKVSNDPIRYACQKNFILGIGDVNTHNDKNLPGSTAASGEPNTPAEVESDETVNVVTATRKVGQLEHISLGHITSSTSNFTGRGNSAYIAGLAYDSHTKDMRPDLDGMQTVSTYWVDVEEAHKLYGIAKNQYLLATKYGGFTVPNGYKPYTRTDPLPDDWWSTSGDVLRTSNVNEKRPDNFFEGGDAAAMRSGLNAAFSAIESANAGSKASLSLNSTQLENNSRIYQASYVEGSWSGSVSAYAIDPSTQTVSSAPVWKASVPPAEPRTAYTLVSGKYEKFTAGNVSGHGWTSSTIEYALGDASKEIKKGGQLRNRSTAIGDIVHSQPVFVGAPNVALFAGMTFEGASQYSAFANDEKDRIPVIYVAANDGFLHGFNANSGVETYAYMPGAVVSASVNPSVLSQANYGAGVNPHLYFNDGELTVANAYFSNSWHTVLVGTTGRGQAKAIYALDVTDPSDVTFLWEVSAATNSDIGQTISKPIIAHTNHGWVVLVGNGYNSSNGTAALLSIPLGDSEPTPTVYTTTADSDNGLATPGVWIGNVPGNIATVAYAGDLLGNLWAFDLSADSGAGKLVFSTGAQPITSTIALGLDPSTGDLWAFFGTGKELSLNDLADRSLQSWYGMDVEGRLPLSKSDLIQRSVKVETAGKPADPDADPPTNAVQAARSFSRGTGGDMTKKSGWYMDLIPPDGIHEGERMLVGNQFVDGYLVGTSSIPDTSDPCAPGGRGWVMILDPFTGTNPTSIYFDLNHDALFNSSDEVKDGDTSVAAGGMGFSSLTGAPAFTRGLMLNNLNGTIDSRRVKGPGGNGERVSWRELVNP
jgi:type IV pilus assembly protein PilY1